MGDKVQTFDKLTALRHAPEMLQISYRQSLPDHKASGRIGLRFSGSPD